MIPSTLTLSITLVAAGGVLSSLTSIAWRNYSQPRSHSQITGSHGASGAIYAVVSFFACVAPTTTFYFFGIVPVPAWALVTGIFLYDSYGAVTHSVSRSLEPRQPVLCADIHTRAALRTRPVTLEALPLGLGTSSRSASESSEHSLACYNTIQRSDSRDRDHHCIRPNNNRFTLS